MNRNELFSALSGIDEKYLNEACSYELRRRQKRARILQIVFPAAALISLLLVTLFTLPLLTGSDSPLPSVPSQGVEPNPMPSPDLPPPVYSEGLVYQKHEDHAVIVQLQGNGQVAQIPQFLDNLPVTKVELAEGTVPKNYTVISFNGEMLEALTLPKNQELTLVLGKNVTKINPSALLNTSLSAVTVDEENPVYASFMGVLYSKDLSVLIACPAGLKATDFTNEGLIEEAHRIRIPEKTKQIADRAFAGNRNLINVTLPEGITFIGSSAFEGCASLRSITLPLSLEEVSRNALANAPMLDNLHYAGSKENLAALEIVLPIGCRVYHPLAQSKTDLEIDTLTRFFLESEECVAWFSRFHFIPCDWGIEIDGYYPVDMEGITTMEELRAHLEKYFEKQFVDRLFAQSEDGDQHVFKEIDGVLHMKPSDLPISFAAGERSYSFVEQEDGSILVTVRVKVPGTVANICVDCSYLLTPSEDGYCFTEEFVLPVEKWYPLYLVNSH